MLAPGPRAIRTIDNIKDATREVFLRRGYSGTTVDEIASVAGVSRASFYTYFPSKREVLIAVGEASSVECGAAISRLATVDPSLKGIEGWVREYFSILDVHGSFAFAWTQAAAEDEVIQTAGMRAHLRLCRRLGDNLGTLVGLPHPDPKILGLTALGMLDRSWDFARQYSNALDRSAVEAQVARMIWGAIRPVAARARVPQRP